MLDAGPAGRFRSRPHHQDVYDLPYRGFGKPGRFPHVTQANEFNGNLWADEKQNPYTYDPDESLLLGPRTHDRRQDAFWGRASWRLSDYEFKGKDHDGFGENWPISYTDLAPLLRQGGAHFARGGPQRGLAAAARWHLYRRRLRPAERSQRFIAAAKKQGIPTTQTRRATGQMASSVNLLLPDAMATGNLTIVPNAVVRNITTDRTPVWPTAFTLWIAAVQARMHVKARVVVVGASCLESTRLLAQLQTGEFQRRAGALPVRSVLYQECVQAIVPEAHGGKGAAGLMGGGGYIPRFRNLD